MDEKNIRKLTAALILLFLFLEGCSDNNSNKEDVTSSPNQQQTEESSFDFVKKLGIGWNLGNTLDSSDYKKITDSILATKANEYQIMGVYTTKEWSAWDASSTPYFTTEGMVELVWKMDSLNSGKEKACGKLSFQLINHGLNDSNGQVVGLQVTKAEFVTKDNRKVVLDDMVNQYQLTIKDGVSEYVDVDISSNDTIKTTNDLIGGTFTLEAEIISYPASEEETQSAAEYYETLWGNPLTTDSMIVQVEKQGFQSVRIPVTYADHMDENGTIDKAWLDRVEEVVNMVLDHNMYCIINMHHDVGKGAWLTADQDGLQEEKERFINAWMQIATRFASYDERLVFEGYNEILNKNQDWSDAGDECYKAANELNQAFVDTVRSRSGYNTSRYLLLNTYAAGGAEDIINGFQLPEDTANDKLLASIHYYGELDKMDTIFGRLDQKFVENKIPVVIGEFASFTTMEVEESITYVTQFLNEAKSRGYAVLWWDRGATNDTGDSQTRTLLDRNNLTWYDPTLADAVIKAYQP